MERTNHRPLRIPFHETVISFSAPKALLTKHLRFLGRVQPIKHDLPANASQRFGTYKSDLGERELPNLRLPELMWLEMGASLADLEKVAKYYPALAGLEIRGAPATLRNVKSLDKLRSLFHLRLVDTFGFGPSDFPDREPLPQLSVYPEH
jgi:hypothetical protein